MALIQQTEGSTPQPGEHENLWGNEGFYTGNLDFSATSNGGCRHTNDCVRASVPITIPHSCRSRFRGIRTLSSVTPPAVVERCMCGCHCWSRPHVWITAKPPGRRPARRPLSSTTSAASSHRLWYISVQNSQGRVNVMCCHSPSGTRLSRYCIQISPAFTPQCGQERLLQRKQTFLYDHIRGLNSASRCNPSAWCHRP